MIRPIIVLILAASATRAAGFIADSSRGRDLFDRLSCVQCHSINGKGGSIGPDLGRIVDRGFTPAMLAATMWNHAPKMWAAMGEMGIRAGHMSDQGAADLFAFFYSTHFFELPGDAARGKRLFAARGCANCHGLNQPASPQIKPVSQWEALDNPVALTEAMWNHASQKLAEIEAKHKAWRALTSQDLSDILVYLRNLPFPRSGVPAFQIGAGGSGEAVFRERGCANCHKSGPELSKATRGKTLTQVAAAMWNHEPVLAKVGAAQTPFSPGDMKDLLGYLWAGQFFENAGSPAAGRRAFTSKRCASCHEGGSGVAPKLTGRGDFNGATIVSALWRHGPSMLDQMKKNGVPWPRFEGTQMADLLAYLNSIK